MTKATQKLLDEFETLPDQDRSELMAVLRMEFKTFLNAFMRIPVQVVRTSRRLVFRLLAWNPWQHVLLRGLDQLHGTLPD